MSSVLPFFALGLLLGGSATWLARHSAAPATASILRHPSSIMDNWSWRDSATPPALAPDAVGPALAAWLSLRAPDGSPASQALRAATLRALLVRLPAAGFPRLLDTFPATALSPDESRLLTLAFDAWTGRDPAAAARWAMARGPGSRALAVQAARAWAAIDAPASAAWACAFPDRATALQLAKAILPALARQDPAAAFALAGSRDSSFRVSVGKSILSALGEDDPAAALRTYGPKIVSDEGFWALGDSFAVWIKKDPATAFAWAATQPGGDGLVLELNLEDWPPQITPGERRALIDAIASVPDLKNRAIAMGSLVSSWGRENPAEALAWIGRLADSDLRLSLLQSASCWIGKGDPPANVLTLALALPEGASRTKCLSALLGQWAGTDSAATLAWINANAADPGVARAASAVQATLLADIARAEPQTALAEWRAIPDPAARAAAVGPITASWAKTDPAAALQWWGEQTRTLDKPAGFDPDFASAWAKQDPEAALNWVAAWVARHPPPADQVSSPYIHPYLAALGGTWDDRAPRGATADLYAKIQDPALRTDTLTKHVREWLTKDPAAAKAWLESHDVLSPAQAAALLAIKL